MSPGSRPKSLEELKLAVKHDDPFKRDIELETAYAVIEQLKTLRPGIALDPEDVRYIGNLWRVLAPYFERRG
jgi:predicted Holliday junction resolvase-like endonuclease